MSRKKLYYKTGQVYNNLKLPPIKRPELIQPHMNQPRMNQPRMNQPRMNQPHMKLPELIQPRIRPHHERLHHHTPHHELPQLVRPEMNEEMTTMSVKYKMLKNVNPGNPEVWGPAFWFSLHNGAVQYPKNAAPIWRKRMKSFIKGIPVMVPCSKCSEHASAYIESLSDEKLNDIVKNRDKLFKFFVDFHNFVNKRIGKNTFSLEAVEKMFKGPAEVLTVEFHPTN